MRMPARAIDTARISFGLVTIPVRIYSTSQPSEEIHFHMVHAGCGERLKQQYVCPEHGPVDRADIVKGFELAKGNVIELEKEELKALDAVATDEIGLNEFVPQAAIDPIYVDNTYYLAPDKGGDRAFRLFRDALEDSELAGVASYSARGKEYVVMLRPFEDGLAMHQLRYPDEIKPFSDVPIGKLPKASAPELRLATQVIESLRHDTFDATQYKDHVKARVRKLIAEKAKGGEIVAPEHVERAEIPDLMAALKASLGGGHAEDKEKEKPARTNGRGAARGHRTSGTHRRSSSHAHRSAKSTTRSETRHTRTRAHR
jgi:DNA end-binding protein Ku